MYESSDLRKGLKIEIDGDPYLVVQFEFVKPGKGQALYNNSIERSDRGINLEKQIWKSVKWNTSMQTVINTVS
jgi:elongation factor P